MMLAGLPVADRLVLELSKSLRDAGFDDTAATLEDAYDREVRVVALTIPDREAILRALEDAPDGLAEPSRRARARARVARTHRTRLAGYQPDRAVDAREFLSVLEQVRELHQLADELARSKTWIEANVRARLSWEPDPPPLPPEQRELADEVVEVLAQPQLSSWQARQLQKAFFGK